MTIKDVTDDLFDAEVLKAPQPVLVDFWAEWCMPCRKIHVMLDEIAGTELGEKVTIVKMNIDENQRTALTYGVMGLPTLTIFKGGDVAGTITGAKPKTDLIRFIESVV